MESDDPRIAQSGDSRSAPDRTNRSWGADGDTAETRDRHTSAQDPTIMAALDLIPQARPENPYQALMEAAPHEEPAEDVLAFQERMQPVRDALEDPDLLTERERWIVEARFFWQLSVREVADLLPWSVTHVHRIEHQAREKLAERLAQTYKPLQEDTDND